MAKNVSVLSTKNIVLYNAVKTAVNHIGGIESFIQPNDTVLLKPNFNTADPFPASSDLGFVKAVLTLLSDHGITDVILGDSSTISKNSRKVMDKKGVFELQKDVPNLRILVFDEHPWIKKKIPNGRYLKTVSVPEIFDHVDKLVLLPCLKTHRITQFTGSLKLSVGFMKPRERIALHFRHTQKKIGELNRVINPDLVIMDARDCFITRGPEKGDVREPNKILASTDRVAIDIEGIKIIQSYEGNDLEGLDPSSLPQITSFQ